MASGRPSPLANVSVWWNPGNNIFYKPKSSLSLTGWFSCSGEFSLQKLSIWEWSIGFAVSSRSSRPGPCPMLQWNLSLSHTWVRYPGFSGHGIKCAILATVVPGFPAIWLDVPFGANGTHLGICTLPEKKLFVCEISCFCVKLSFLKRELVLWSLYGDKLSICRNQRMNGKI